MSRLTRSIPCRRPFAGVAIVATLLVACEAADRPDATQAAPAAPPAAAVDAEAIRTVAREYHAALESGDSLRAIELLHPEVVIYEGGHAETLEQYRGGHLAADIGFAQAVESEVLSEQVIDLGGAALYLSESRTRGTFRNREIDSRGTETLVLVPADGAWLIRHIHWSSAR